ncbi:hypothetical protein [uncultured Schumannella sp.]|uniref:hypothetical protein n=1 Tax=uncultured Schumannella sp. TaxID=1195956 RepID=UPI0025E806F4|nr:hypothetical protein [uncultured Schumannella sp.]
MELALNLVLVLHFLGLAAIIGVFLVQMRANSGFRTDILLAGAITQVVTGLALVGMRQMGDLGVDNAKIAVKLIVALVVLVAAIVANVNQRKHRKIKPAFHAAGGLAIVNVVIAVLWE